MSLQSVSQGLESLFGIPLSRAQIAEIKSNSAAEYLELYGQILHIIVEGFVVHADETKISVDEKLGYVWAFANLESVAYVFSDTRDAGTLKNVLGSFTGVLVSDFYAAYDGIDTAQQKCLIHLLRDINEDVLRNPFNGEMEEVALHVNPVSYSELRYTLEKYGFEIVRVLRDKPKKNLWVYWPVVALIRLMARLTSERKRRERWTEELQSDEVLLGGNTLIIHAIKKG